MKKLVLLTLALLLTSNLFGAEVTWETLKTLDFDLKTKKNIIKPELQNVLGKEITIKGFMMPLDYDAKEIVEFLFMPYVPACMHVPPPPANQLILVHMKKGNKIKPSFYPIELKGVLAVEANADLESSFKMDGIAMKELKDAPAMVPPGVKP